MKALVLLSFLILTTSTNGQFFRRDSIELTGPYLGQTPLANRSQVFAPGFVSTEYDELNSVFTGDGNEYYFSRRGIPGKKSEIMVSKTIHNVWMKPEPLDFTGMYNDIDLFVTPDGKSMIFCSTRPHQKGGEEKHTLIN